MTITEAEIRALVNSATRKHGESVSTLGVHADALAVSSDAIEVEGRAWQVAQLDSPYLVRRALSRLGKDERLVVVTPLDEGDLGTDVLSRFPSPRLERVEPWRMVREIFMAETLDPRLSSLSWLPRVVQSLSRLGTLERSSDRHLSLEHAWQELLAILGVPRKPMDVDRLLGVDVSQARRGLDAVPSECRSAFQASLESWVKAAVGPAGVGIVRAWASETADSPLVLGVALDVLLRSQEAEKVHAGWVRLSDRAGMDGSRTTPGYDQWANAAVARARRILADDPQAFDGLVQTATQFLDETLKVTSCAAASRVLPAGLAAARTTLATAVQAVLAGSHDVDGRNAVRQVTETIEEHVIGAADASWLRLLRRVLAGLAEPEPTGVHVHELAARYRDDLAWLEAGADRLARGHAEDDLRAAIDRVQAVVRDRLRTLSAAFGQAVATEFAGGRGPFLPLEDVLEKVIDPLVKDTGANDRGGAVLMIVMDGMSWPVAQRIYEEIGQQPSLRRLTLEQGGRWRPVISPLPSVTKVARASLISGRLVEGDQAQERDGLRAAVGRFGWTDSSGKDQVLHKDALDADDRKILGLKSSVVVAVVNAVDDQLKTGGQLRPEWSLDELPILKELIEAAVFERRSIVVVADHGHIEPASGESPRRAEKYGERWRTPVDQPGDGELEIRGDRVVLPVRGGPIVVPIDDRVRYVSRSAGHHGGASPQEMVCPLAVFVPSSLEIAERWIQELVAPPAWWNLDPVPVAAKPDRSTTPTTEVPDPVHSASAEKPPSPTVKGVESDPPAREAGGEGVADANWVARLVGTGLFTSQRTTAGRRAPDPDRIARMLGLLDEAGGAMGMDELASRMQMPRTRLQGFLASTTKILNVDGFQVLSTADGGQQVRLDRPLACRQFEVEETA